MKNGWMMRLALVLGCLALMLSCPHAAFSDGGNKPVDVGVFMKELMQLRLDGQGMHMAIWMPYELFVEMGVAGGSSRADAEKDMAMFKNYQPVLIMSTLTADDGTETVASEKALMTRTVLRAVDGTEVHPLATFPPKMSMMLDVMKKAMASQFGEDKAKDLVVLVFPASTPDGKLVVNAAKKDKLTLVMKKDNVFPQISFIWHTPFDAVQATKTCAKCGEDLSAKWSYCPFCGEKIP